MTLGALISVVFGSSAGVVFARLSEPAPVDAGARAPAVAAPALAGDILAVPAPRTKPSATRKRSEAWTKACGDRGARLIRFRVSVEKGLATTKSRFARDVVSVLCDERSWIASGTVRFRYDPKGPILIGLRSAAATERRCLQLIGLSVHEKYSCAGTREVVLNADRWFGGSPSWPGSVANYRRLLVNHEVGHILGHRHRGCTKPGGRAPVMMQQSKGTGGCRPNPWPLPSELRATR